MKFAVIIFCFLFGCVGSSLETALESAYTDTTVDVEVIDQSVSSIVHTPYTTAEQGDVVIDTSLPEVDVASFDVDTALPEVDTYSPEVDVVQGEASYVACTDTTTTEPILFAVLIDCSGSMKTHPYGDQCVEKINMLANLAEEYQRQSNLLWSIVVAPEMDEAGRLVRLRLVSHLTHYLGFIQGLADVIALQERGALTGVAEPFMTAVLALLGQDVNREWKYSIGESVPPIQEWPTTDLPAQFLVISDEWPQDGQKPTMSRQSFLGILQDQEAVVHGFPCFYHNKQVEDYDCGWSSIARDVGGAELSFKDNVGDVAAKLRWSINNKLGCGE